MQKDCRSNPCPAGRDYRRRSNIPDAPEADTASEMVPPVSLTGDRATPSIASRVPHGGAGPSTAPEDQMTDTTRLPAATRGAPPRRRHFAAVLTVVALTACAQQPVQENTPVPSPGEGVERTVLVEPGLPPPDLATPGDTEILERLRARAAARRAATARQHFDAGDRRHADVWARLRAGFALPAVDHRAVAAEIDWYASSFDYLQHTTDRARLYLAYIVQEAERRKLPLELALLPIVESAFQPYARSPAGAMGIWQFMRSTGRRFGLEQTGWYDARRDIVESTRAAFEYLERLHEHLDGDWLLAVAAYNAGEGTVARARRRNRARGKPVDFFSLSLPAETRSYVPRLLAIAALVRDPQRHGLTLDPIDDAVYFRSVDVGSQISLGKAAKMAGITLNEMMLLNPGFFRHATDPDGPHRLLLPAEAAQGFQQALAETDPSERMTWSIHTVASGESLSAIASRYRVSVDQLKRANAIQGTLLRVGQELEVPTMPATTVVGELSAEVRRGMERARISGQRRVYRVRRGDSLWAIARRSKLTVSQLMAWNGLGKRSVLRPGQKLVIWNAPSPSSVAASGNANADAAFYTVRRGDSLWEIARRHKLSTRDLAAWNALSISSLLRPGQKLRLSPPRSAGLIPSATGA